MIKMNEEIEEGLNRADYLSMIPIVVFYAATSIILFYAIKSGAPTFAILVFAPFDVLFGLITYAHAVVMTKKKYGISSETREESRKRFHTLMAWVGGSIIFSSVFMLDNPLMPTFVCVLDIIIGVAITSVSLYKLKVDGKND